MTIETFTDVFDFSAGSSHATCECDTTFYNTGGWYDWDEGELDLLDADENAIEIDETITFVNFEGCLYITQCDCWKERAKKIIKFIDSHAVEIANYLNTERANKIADAERVALVEILSDEHIK